MAKVFQQTSWPRSVRPALGLALILIAGLAVGKGAGPSAEVMTEHLDKQFRMLRTFHETLESEGTDDAAAWTEAAEQAFSFFADWERTRRAVARGIRLRADEEAVVALANAFVDAAQKAQQCRMGQPFEILAHEAGDMPAERYTEGLEECIAFHEAMRDAGEALAPHQAVIAVQPRVAIYGPTRFDAALDETIEIEFLVENYGGAALKSVDFSLEAFGDKALPATFKPAGFERLAVGNSGVVQMMIDFDDPVRRTQTFTLRGQTAAGPTKGRPFETIHSIRITVEQ